MILFVVVRDLQVKNSQARNIEELHVRISISLNLDRNILASEV